MVVPISTYQGNAIRDTGAKAGARAGTAALICLANTITLMHAMPTDMPRIASD